MISLASAYMNSVSCQHAPNCTNLNRNHCLDSENTCGKCLLGYIGNNGDSNTPCSLYYLSPPAQSLRRRMSDDATVCAEDKHCKIGHSCLSSHCITTVPSISLKVCDNNCSSHGICIYRITSSRDIVDMCELNNFKCDAICECYPDYAGRTCELSKEEMDAKKLIRTQLIDSLYSVTNLDDINADSLISWSNNLYSLARNSYEISDQAILKLMNIAQLVVTNAGKLNMNKIQNIIGMTYIYIYTYICCHVLYVVMYYMLSCKVLI